MFPYIAGMFDLERIQVRFCPLPIGVTSIPDHTAKKGFGNTIGYTIHILPVITNNDAGIFGQLFGRNMKANVSNACYGMHM